MTIYYEKEDIVSPDNYGDPQLDDMVHHYYIINNKIIYLYYSEAWNVWRYEVVKQKPDGLQKITMGNLTPLQYRDMVMTIFGENNGD